jgi:hypothetical protein
MAKDAGGGRPPSEDDGPLFGMESLDALAEADDGEVLALGSAVLAELKDRGLLRVLLRNRSDAATAFEVDAIREAEDGLDLIAAGYHAETPEQYPGWVVESDQLRQRLDRPGLSEQEVEAMLGRATDEALLLTLDSARLAETEEEDEEPTGRGRISLPTDTAVDSLGTRVAIELLRRGIIEAEPEEEEGAGRG